MLCGGVGFWLSAFGCMGGDINGRLVGPGVGISTCVVQCVFAGRGLLGGGLLCFLGGC